jgi:hypothetical protein
MLHLNHDAGRRFYIGAVDFSVRCGVTDFSAMLWEEILPVAMPSRFVLPPRIAIPTARVSPMVHDARPAFSNHRRATGGAIALSDGEGLTALIVNYGVLQNRSIPTETSSIGSLSDILAARSSPVVPFAARSAVLAIKSPAP